MIYDWQRAGAAGGERLRINGPHDMPAHVVSPAIETSRSINHNVVIAPIDGGYERLPLPIVRRPPIIRTPLPIVHHPAPPPARHTGPEPRATNSGAQSAGGSGGNGATSAPPQNTGGAGLAGNGPIADALAALLAGAGGQSPLDAVSSPSTAALQALQPTQGSAQSDTNPVAIVVIVAIVAGGGALLYFHHKKQHTQGAKP